MTFARQGRALNISPVFFIVVAITVLGSVMAWVARPDTWTAKIGVFLLVIFGWIITLCLHEFAHAYQAFRAGDRDVEVRGYLTLNPLKYSHPLLSIALPVLFIALGGIGLPGGAVYLDNHNFNDATKRRVSLSGPAVNAAFAVLLLVVARVFGSDDSHPAFWFGLSFLALLQIMATVLNLLPIPGFDGYGALEPSLSYQTRRSLEQFKPWGMLALFAVLWGIPPIAKAFFGLCDAIFGLSGIPLWWSDYGQILTQFWR